MKSYKPNTMRYFVFLLSAIIVYAFTLLGCAIVTTSKAPEGNIEGIVYHLPKSYLKVSIESKKDKEGNHSELVVGTCAEIMPDKKARLILKPSGNDLFTRDHKFIFTNGLLSSLVTNDEGKSGEILTNLATIAMNVIKFGAQRPPLVPDVVKAPKVIPPLVDELETKLPSNKEIMTALSSIAPGRHDFLFELTSEPEQTELLGTAGLLWFKAKIEELLSPLPEIRPENLQDLNKYKGIATRVLEPYPVKISLNLKLSTLYSNRIAAYKRKIEDLNKAIDQTTYSNRIAAYKRKIEDLNKAIDQTTKKITDIEKKLKKVPDGSAEAGALKAKITKEKETLEASEKDKAKITKEKETLEASEKDKEDAIIRNEEYLKNLANKNEVYEIANRSSLILIPDCSPIVKIPLTRAPLGITKFTLTLNQGILTDYHAEHPSTTLEIVKVPLKISEALVSLPAEILKLKIDYSSRAQALLDQQAKYQDTLKAIAEKKNEPSAYDEQVKALEQEKAILQLKREIAELKAAISKLESR